MIDFIVANPFRQRYTWNTEILGVMDCATAHSGGYSSQCSCTRCTAHSRISEKNFI